MEEKKETCNLQLQLDIMNGFSLLLFHHEVVSFDLEVRKENGYCCLGSVDQERRVLDFRSEFEGFELHSFFHCCCLMPAQTAF